MNINATSEMEHTVTTTSNGVPIRNLWHMLLYAWGQSGFMGRWLGEAESAPSLQALLAKVLCDLVRQRLRIGLGRNYRTTQRTILGVRGRVDFGQSIKTLAFQEGRAHCRYQVFSPDVPKNQIIRSTLDRLARAGDFSPESSASDKLRRELRLLTRVLEEIDFVELTSDTVVRQRLERDDRDYRLMLAICSLILHGQMPTTSKGAWHSLSVDHDWQFVWRVFEEFVASFYTLRLPTWTVSSQPKLSWPVGEPNPFMPKMEPDLVLEHDTTGEILVLDTKFTKSSLVEKYEGSPKFHRGHLYQLYAYVRSQEEQSNMHRFSNGVLLYPTVKTPLQEVAFLQGHTICWKTVDLAEPWESIENELLVLPDFISNKAATACEN